jgi:hypothetical protein
MPGWGASQTVGPEAAGPLIAVIRSGLETVEVALRPLYFPNQGFFFFPERSNTKLFRLSANLLHFHGFSLPFKETAGRYNFRNPHRQASTDSARARNECSRKKYLKPTLIPRNPKCNN